MFRSTVFSFVFGMLIFNASAPELNAEEIALKAGDIVVVSAAETDLVRDGKTVAQLKRGTKFEIAKVTASSLAGFATIDGKKQPGWLKRSEVAKTLAATPDNDGTAPKTKPQGIPQTAPAGDATKVVKQAADDEPNVPLKYMSLARIRALPSESNFDAAFLDSQLKIDPKRAVVSLDIVGANGAKVDNCLLRPDGKVVVTSTAEGTVFLTEYNTQRSLANFQAHEGPLRMAFSPDGGLLVTGGFADGKIKLWQMKNQELLTNWEQKSSIRSIEFSPDGKWILCGSYDPKAKTGGLIVYDVEQRKRKFELEGENYGAIDVAFSPDSKRIAAVRIPKVRKDRNEPMCWVEVWDWATAKRIFALPNFYSMATCVDFSTDGKELAIGETEGESLMNVANRVRIVDANSGKNLAILIGHRDFLADVKYAPNGKTLASMSLDRTLRVWDTTTRKLIGLAATESGYDHSQISFAADSRTLAVSNTKACNVLGEDRLAYIYDIAYTVHFYGSTANRVHVISFSPDQKHVMFGRQGAVNRFDLANSTEEEIIPESAEENVPHIRQLSEDGRLAARSAMTIQIFSLPDAKLVSECAAHDPTRLSSEKIFSPNGELYAAGYSDGVIEVWQVKRGKLLGTAKFDLGFPGRMAFSRDSKRLFAADFNAPQPSVGIWDLSDRKEPTGAPLEHVRDVPAGTKMHQLYPLPDGERLLVVGEPSAMIDLKTLTVTPVPLSVWFVAYSDDGKLLATAGEKVEYEVIRILDATTLKEIVSMRGPHPGAVRALKFSPDGKILASGCEAGIFALWDTQTGKEIHFDAKAKFLKDYLKSKGKAP